MAGAASLRLLAGLGGGVAALAIAFWVQPVWLGVTVAGVVLVASQVLSERLWRRHATLEQVRADLEDRVRNEPS